MARTALLDDTSQAYEQNRLKIPRRAVPSEPPGFDDRVHLLKSRCRDPFVRRFVVPSVPSQRWWIRYPLDVRGSRIWQLIDDQRAVADVVEAYRQKYPQDLDQIDARIWRFLVSLQHHGFLTIE